MNKNLKNEYPNVSESFHNRVISTLNSLQNCERQDNSRRFSPIRVAVLAATLIILLAVTVFAGSEVYQRFINKENYKVTLELGEESSVQSAEYVKLTFGYMPDYLIPFDAPYKFSIGEDGVGGLTFQLFKSEIAKDLEITYADSVEECMFGKNKGAIIKIDTGIEYDYEAYSRNFVIYFDDFGYVLRCYVSDSISDEEMMKIANGLSLEKTDMEQAFIPDTYIPGVEEMSEAVIFEDKSQRAYKNIGDEFNISYYSGTAVMGNFCVTVNDFEIRDNVAGLDYDCFRFDGDDFDKYVDENGNLKDYVRNTIEYGDGINTLNSIKESENIGRQLVIVNLKIENTENYDHNFCPEFYLLNANGEYVASGVNYISGQGSNSGKYYFIPFEAGENKTVAFGFVVDDDIDLNGLYIEIASDSLINYRIALNN